ncbi:hypothetical protein [Nocardia pseudovaccinii]|uniref:hypothetical protein n=1 Tax=Nocardia pseudovaccinii TaxID=189540 RepID=UPI0007A37CE8|nr:hypothetical protein [Nocardia pseudovaccinii]
MSGIRARALVVAVATSSIVLGAGCAHEPAIGSGKVCTATGFASPYATVDPCSGEAVLRAAVAAVFTYQPQIQADQRVAFQHAKPLLDPAFAAAGESAATVFTPITAARWQEWRTQLVSVTATARITGDDHPPDTATLMSRVLGVDLHLGEASPAMRFAVYAHVTRSGLSSPWLVAALEVTG